MKKLQRTAALAAVLALCAAASAQTLEGARVKVSGAWDGTSLRATKLRQRDPRKDARRASLSGEIASVALASERFVIASLPIAWDEDTEFVGLTARDLRPGLGVEVVASIGDRKALRALTVERASVEDHELSLLAVVEQSRLARDGSTELVLLGLPVVLPRTLPLPQLALTRRPDERRPSEQLTIPVGRGSLTLGGEVETALGGQHDNELGDDDDDELTLDSELQLELAWQIAPAALVFLEAKLADERELAKQGGGPESDSFVERGETWLYLRAPGESGLSLQLGRQAFSESREWWWDDDLDALRVHWNRFPFSIELGVAQELGAVSSLDGRIDPEERGVLRGLARASWGYAPGHMIEAFALRHADHSRAARIGEVIAEDREDASDARLFWAGVRACGDFDLPSRFGLTYWADLALVDGSEEVFDSVEVPGGVSITARSRRSVRGYGFDLGTTLTTPWPMEPHFSASFAFGSGKRDASDRGFRQTGLNDNNGRFEGVEGFRYYGQALDPELSNLSILTLGLGISLLADSSIDLVYHRYRQHRRADFMRNAEIDFDPTGASADLGHGLDLVIGVQEWEHLELEIVLGAFRAGRAFAGHRGDIALDGFVRVGWKF